MEFLDELNIQQREAVTARENRVLVLAGPGSGKTRVLTFRIAYLVAGMGVRPYNVLAVTFTNKAAREMQHRVEKTLGEGVMEGIWLGTFHGMCARLLRRESDYLPYTRSFVIMDADDQEKLVKKAIRELKIDEKSYKPASMQSAISHAKNNMQTADTLVIQTYRDEVIKRIYTRYQDLLLASNAMDFDDLLLNTVRLLQENPDVREKYQGRFGHILVDEFQDTNKVQYELLHLLSSPVNNLFVVGDEDQSIYRWRGADYMNVLRFEQDYPDCRKLLLEENYRSTQTVLDAARAVIDRNLNRTPKDLSSARGLSGARITCHEAADDYAEASFVVDTIVAQMVGKSVRGGDFAVMFRTNAQSRLLENAFMRSGVGYRLVGAQRFYGRREVKDLVAFLRLAQNPRDEISLERVINVPGRGIGDKTVLTLQTTARRAGCSMGEVLIELGAKGPDSAFWEDFKGRGAVLLADFGVLLARWNRAADGPLPEFFDRIIEETGYEAYIHDADEEGEDRWGNVQELRKQAYEYAGRGLTEFLENLALVSDQDTVPEGGSVPTLLTLHAAKGLEFRQVFIIGLDEGVLPHKRALDDPEEMAEERRLFYVGLTRAMDNLYLVRAERRSSFGSYEDSIPSRFLRDIPSELIEGEVNGLRRSSLLSREESRSRRPSMNQQILSRWEAARQLMDDIPQAPPVRKEPDVQQLYKPTQRVSHPVWGEGIILESKVEDGEEVVDVMFRSVGFKRLIASLAKLTPL